MTDFSFVQLWMALVGAAIMIAAVIHKRRYFRPGSQSSLMKRILLVSLVYFLPAAVGWCFVAGFALRILADSEHVIPGVVKLFPAVGVYVLGHIILRAEIDEARKLPPR